MGIEEDEFYEMPLGIFLDLWAGHKQYHGIEHRYKEVFIDELPW